MIQEVTVDSSLGPLNPTEVLLTVDGAVLGLVKRITVVFDDSDTLVRAVVQHYVEPPREYTVSHIFNLTSCLQISLLGPPATPGV